MAITEESSEYKRKDMDNLNYSNSPKGIFAQDSLGSSGSIADPEGYLTQRQPSCSTVFSTPPKFSFEDDVFLNSY